MASNPTTPPSASPPRSSVGSSPVRSRATRDLVAQVARDAVVETLRSEMGAARRESVFASTELVEVREACRSEVQRYEQDKQRLAARLKSQKTRLDEVLLGECQARRRCSNEIEEKQKLELKLKTQEAAFQEERIRERNGSRRQLEMLQQRCLEASAAQVDLQHNCTTKLDAAEAVEIQAAERQAALEIREKEFLQQESNLTLARKNSQAALDASKSEEAWLRSRLAYAEQEVAEITAKVVHGEEEAQRCAELRFELMHAVHHELPIERSRVSELEATQQAEAERIRGVCEAEVSDLPPNLLEKVQSAIRRHEAWLTQWSAGKRESGFSDHRTSGTVGTTSGEGTSLTNATTRYESVLGALAQCAGGIARENIELRARLATPTPEDAEQVPPEIQKQMTSMKREIAKLREENRELQIQRQMQEEAANRLRRDMVAVMPSREEQLLQLQRKKLPGTDVQLHTEHRRNMKVLDAEMQVAQRHAESLRVELVQQENSHTEVVAGLRQENSNLQVRCREVETLRRALQIQEASAENSINARATNSESDSCFKNKAQKAEMERRLTIISRRLGDLAGGRAGKANGFAERELERELLRLCERLNHEVAAGKRERRALAEDCRLKDIAAIEWAHRCQDLENTLKQRDRRLQELEGKASTEERVLEVESLRNNRTERVADRRPEEPFDGGSRRHRPSARHQLDQRRRAAKESMEIPNSGAAKASGARPIAGDDRKPVAALLQRWVKGAIERQDAETTNTSPSSSSISPKAGPFADGIERKPVANLLQRWVTKALESDEDRAASESPTVKKHPIDRQPVQALLSRWVKKAVNSQEDEEFDARAEEGQRSPSPKGTHGARSSGHVDTAIDAENKRSAPSDTTYLEEARPLTPRSPASRSRPARGGVTSVLPANAGDEESPQDSNQSIRSCSCKEESVAEDTSPMQSQDVSESAGSTESDLWRSIDIDRTSGLMNWLGDTGLMNHAQAPELLDLDMTATNLDRQRLPSVAEEPSSGNSPAGAEEDPEEIGLEVTFQHAEALCDSQHYTEALPIFQDLLVSLQGKTSPAMRSLQAEVRAHMGVTLQSLGRVEDAIEAYSSAVRQDPSLHVCHANLAQLYAYLEDFVRARLHLNTAIRLNPLNSMYIQLDEQFRANATTNTLGL